MEKSEWWRTAAAEKKNTFCLLIWTSYPIKTISLLLLGLYCSKFIIG